MDEQDLNGGAPGNDGGADIEKQKEIDRAVTKALKTQKENLEKEHNAKLKTLQDKLDAFENNGLTDAEKAAKQVKAAAEKEALYVEKLKRLEVGQEFSNMGVEEADYSPILDDFFKGDFKNATSKLSAIIEKKATALAETKYKALTSNIPEPNQGNDKDKKWTKESFGKLTYSQQMAEIEKNPELIKLI